MFLLYNFWPNHNLLINLLIKSCKNSKVLIKIDLSLWHLGDGTTPLIVKKFAKTPPANAVNAIFCECYQNPLRQLPNNFETLSALGACQKTIIGGVVHKKSMILIFFLEYLSESLLYHHEMFLVARSYSSCKGNLRRLFVSGRRSIKKSGRTAKKEILLKKILKLFS